MIVEILCKLFERWFSTAFFEAVSSKIYQGTTYLTNIQKDHNLIFGGGKFSVIYFYIWCAWHISFVSFIFDFTYDFRYEPVAISIKVVKHVSFLNAQYINSVQINSSEYKYHYVSVF